MAIKAFATPEEYTAAYGAVADEKRLEALLLRATGYLLGKMDGYTAGVDAWRWSTARYPRLPGFPAYRSIRRRREVTRLPSRCSTSTCAHFHLSLICSGFPPARFSHAG